MSTFNLFPDATPGGIGLPSNLSGVRYYIHSFIGPPDGFYDVSTRSSGASSTNQNRIIGIYKVNTSVSPNVVDPVNLINDTNIVNITSNIVAADISTGRISFNLHNTYSPSFRIQNLETGVVYYIYLITNYNSLGTEVECGLTPFSVINYINTGTILRGLDLYETGDLINSNFPSSQGSQGLYPMGTTLRYYKYTFGPGLSSYDVHIATNSNASTTDRIESIFKERDGERTNIISSTTITSQITFTGFGIGTGGAAGNIITLGNHMTGVRAFTLSGLDSTASYSIILRTTNNTATGIDVSLALFNPITSERITLDYVDVGFLSNGVYLFGSDVINRADEQGNIIHTGSGSVLYSWSFTAISPTYDVYMTTSSTAVTIRNINIEPNSNIIANKTAIGPRITNAITLTGFSVGTSTITLPTSTQSNIVPFRLTGLLNTVTNVGAGFLPSSIPNLQLWLDGNDPSGNGTTPSNGSTISTWIDKSSNARNATPRVGSITYNSTTKGLTFNGSSSMNVALTASTNTECAFIVVSVPNVSGDRTLLGASSNSGRQFRITGNNFTTLNQFTTGVLTSAYTVPLDTPFLAQFTMNSSFLIHYANGGRTGIAGSGTYTSGRTTIIGGLYQTNTNTDTEFLTGTIHEILVFSSISTFDRQNIEGYLAWKWGFQSRLPDSHPWKSSNQKVQNSQRYSVIFEATNNTESATSGPDLTFGLVDISTSLPSAMQYDKFGYMISTNGEIIYGKDLIPNVTPSNEAITSITDITRYFRFSFVPTQTSYDVHMATNATANTNHRIVYIGRADGVNIINTNTIVYGTAPAGFSISGGIITPANNQGPSNGVVFALSGLIANQVYYIISRTISNSSGADLRIGLMNFSVFHAPLITYESTRSFINGIDMIAGIEIFQDNTGLGSGHSRLYRYRFQATNSTLDVLISSSSTTVTDNERIVYIGTDDYINLNPTNVTLLSGGAAFSNNNNSITLANSMSGVGTFQLNNLIVGRTYYIIFSTNSNVNSITDARMAIINQTTKSEVTITPDGFSYLHNGFDLINGIEIIRDTALDNTTSIVSNSIPRFFRYVFTPLSSTCRVLLRTNSVAATDERIYYIGTDDGIDIIDTNISNIILDGGLSISNGIITLGNRMYGSPAFTITGLDISKTYYIIVSTINNSSTSTTTFDAEVNMALIDIASNQSITLTCDSIGFFNNGHMLYDGQELVPNVDTNNFPVFIEGAWTGAPIYFRYTFTAPAAPEGNTTSSCDVYLSTASTSASSEQIYSIYKNGGTNIIGTTLATSPQITNFINFTGFTIATGRITVGNSMIAVRAFTLTGLEPGQTYNIIVRSIGNDTIYDMRMFLLNPQTQSEISFNFNQVGYFCLNDTLLFGSDLCPNRDPTNTISLPTDSGGTGRFYIFSFKPITTAYSLYLSNTYNSEEQIVSIYAADSPINIINTNNIINRTSNISITTAWAITFTGGAFNEIRVCTIQNLIPNTDYFVIVRTTYNDGELDLAGGLIDLTAVPPAPLTLKYESTAITLTAPAVSTALSATPGLRSASVNFTPGSTSGLPTRYTVTSLPGGITATGTSPPILVSGLQNNTSYTFVVTSRNPLGSTESTASAPVTTWNVPDEPTYTYVTPGDKQIIIEFITGYNGGDPNTTYSLTAAPDLRTWSGITSPITLDGLTNGTEYTIIITATNGVGSTSSLPARITPLGPPDRPTITSLIRGDRQVTINFIAGSNGGDSTAIYTATSTPAVRSWTGSNSQIVADGLTPGVEYTFIITTTTRVTDISSTVSSSVRAIINPVVVTDVVARRGGGGAAIISFNTGNNIADPSLLYTVTSIPDNKKATGITSPITINGLTNGTSYTFTVTTSNDVGSSLASVPSNSIIPRDTLDRLIAYKIIKDVNHFVTHVETFAFTENIGITLADMKVDMLLADDDKITEARRTFIKYIFEEKPNLSAFQVDRSEILVTSRSTVNNTLLIVKPSAGSSDAPLEIDNILGANISVYADLPDIGSINKFSINKEILTITKTGSDEFLFINGKGIISTHKSGEIIIYNKRAFEFGSVLISNIIEKYEPLTEMTCDGEPPYNATNFTSANKIQFNKLVRYAATQPQYPWPTGSDAQQIFRSKQDITYFTFMNQATAEAHENNTEYPRFDTQGKLLMYMNGMSLTATRNKITGTNPSAPAGVPCSTIYQIINS